MSNYYNAATKRCRAFIPPLFLFFLGAALFVLVSCKAVERPLSFEMPETFTSAGNTTAPEKWWKAFGDADLDRLVERALSHNLDVLSAWDRLDQASAYSKMSDSALWPNISATLGISDTQFMGEDDSQNLSAYSGMGAGTGAGYSSGGYGNQFYGEGTYWSLSFLASYELDLWGRVRSSSKASRADLWATREDLDTMAMTVSAEVARTWYEVVESQAQLAILSEQAKVNAIYLELVELRFSQGMSAAAEVLSQHQQLEATEGEMPLVRMRLELAQHRLAVLLGREPKADLGVGAGSLPTLPPLPDTGIPGELLLERPDVRSAKLRLEAADFRVEEAIANRFPKLSISISAQDQDEEFRSLFDSWIKNLAANLTVPIFEAGRRKMDVKRNRAAASERLHAFEKALLVALREVEDALVQERRYQEFLEKLDRQVEISRQALEFSQERYRNGATNYLPVLINLQTLQLLERRQLEAQRLLITYRIGLYRALGGGWEFTRTQPNDEADKNNDGEVK